VISSVPNDAEQQTVLFIKMGIMYFFSTKLYSLEMYFYCLQYQTPIFLHVVSLWYVDILHHVIWRDYITMGNTQNTKNES
jgi:hypothetical protein